jgi:type I restriction enzyme, S subunit
MNSWSEVKLKDICAKITVGHVGSMANEYKISGIPFLRSQNIKPYQLDLADVKYIDETFNSKLKKSILEVNDLAIIRTGYPGTACVIPDSLGVANCSDLVIIKPGQNVNSHFLAAVFNSTFGQNLVSGNLVGAAQQHFNITSAKELKIKIPPKYLQDKIVAVLNSYNYLIENNKRRIALLEKMAEEIYREWFVRMRFPGHEQVAFHKGIPEGCEIKKLGDLVDTQYGYTTSATDEMVGPKFLRITDIVPSVIDWERVPHCQIDEQQISQYLLEEGDIVVARTGATVGYAKRINKYNPDAIFASYLVRLKPKCKSDNIFLGIAVEGEGFKNFINMVFTGSAQPQANASVMSLFPLLYPSKNLIEQFNLILEPIIDQKEMLYRQISCLRKTRDRLLPRLISGKLTVEDLDIQFPPSMTSPP